MSDAAIASASPGEVVTLLTRASQVFRQAFSAPRRGRLIEIALILLWALWVGHSYLDFNPYQWPTGIEFGFQLQSHYLWTRLQHCGLCALWNGAMNGGYPALADVYGSPLHPLVMIATLLWGAVNGGKVAVVLSLAMAGVAQWWIARTLGVGRVARVWSSLVAVAGGWLAGRLELPGINIVISTATTALALAVALDLGVTHSKRSAAVLGIVLAMSIVAGQGYMQLALLAWSPLFLLLMFDDNFRLHPVWRRYAMAGGLGVLVAGMFLVPLARFLPFFSKDRDVLFAGVQPLAYSPLNLVISDIDFMFGSELGRLPYPYLYNLFIGWVPVLLAMVALLFARRKDWRVLAVLVGGAVVSFCVGSAIPMRQLVTVLPQLANFRYLSLAAGLAVPPILGLAAYGLDHLLAVNWPWLSIHFQPRVSGSGSGVSLAWALAVPLLFSLSKVYQHSQHWFATTDATTLYAAVQYWKTPTLEWVAFPYAEHFWIPAAMDEGLKLTNAAWPWWLKDLAPPLPKLEGTRGEPSSTGELVATSDGLSTYYHRDRSYAYVLVGEVAKPCDASGTGGDLVVRCSVDAPGRLIVQENAFPGWYAWRDQTPVPLLRDRWLKIEAPAGQHVFRFRYLPWEALIGLLLTLLGIGLSIALWMRAPPCLTNEEPLARATSRSEDERPGDIAAVNNIRRIENGLGDSPRPGRWLLPAAVLLAAVLPGLVLADRWLHTQGMTDLFRETWCKVEGLCQTSLPSYVGLGVLGTAAALLLILVPWTRLKFPGLLSQAGLAGSPAPTPDAQAKRVGRILRLAALGGFLVTLLAGLQGAYRAGWQYLPVVLTYAIGSALERADLNDLRRRLRSRLPSLAIGGTALLGLLFLLGGDYASRPAFWLVGLALLVPLALQVGGGRTPGVALCIAASVIVLYAQGINSWRHAILGDEYIFHGFGRSITESNVWALIGERLFDGQGVDGTQPYFSTVIHAAFTWLLGAGNYGWRISNVVAIALAAVAFLHFLRSYLPRPTATLGVILLAFSHYLINFSKIGYNNVQALLATTLVLAAGSWAARSRRPMAFTLLGLAMGLCLYVHPAALYALPLGILLPWIVAPPGQKASLRDYGSALGAISLLLLPLLLQPEYWGTKLAGTLYFIPDLLASTGSLLTHFGSNVLYSLVSHAYVIEEDRFVVSSLVDPLTATFVPIGLALCLKHLRDSRFSRFLVVGFVLEVILVGASHDQQFPPATRMFLLLPWWTTLAAIGITSLAEITASLAWRRRFLAGAAVAAIGLNLYQAFGLFPLRNEGKASFEALFLRLLQRDDIQEPLHPKTYFFLTDPSWGIDGMYAQQIVYDLPRSPDLLGRAVATDAGVEGGVAATIADPDTAVIIQPSMERERIEDLGSVLNALGKTECPVREASGTDVRFSMWLSPELSSLCRWANPSGNDMERFSLARIPVSSWVLVASAIMVLAWRRGLLRRLGSSRGEPRGQQGPPITGGSGQSLRPSEGPTNTRQAHR